MIPSFESTKLHSRTLYITSLIFFAVLLSGCRLESKVNVHSTMKQYSPSSFFGLGNFYFINGDDSPSELFENKKKVIHLNITKDRAIISTVNNGVSSRNYDPVVTVVANNEMKGGSYYAVTYNGSVYRYYLFSFTSNKSFEWYQFKEEHKIETLEGLMNGQNEPHDIYHYRLASSSETLSIKKQIEEKEKEEKEKKEKSKQSEEQQEISTALEKALKLPIFSLGRPSGPDDTKIFGVCAGYMAKVSQIIEKDKTSDTYRKLSTLMMNVANEFVYASLFFQYKNFISNPEIDQLPIKNVKRFVRVGINKMLIDQKNGEWTVTSVANKTTDVCRKIYVSSLYGLKNKATILSPEVATILDFMKLIL